jgi:hypothetical protein
MDISLSEKQMLINGFFDMGGNHNVTKCMKHKEKLQLYADKTNDTEIKELINVITAISIVFESNDVEKARDCVLPTWARLKLNHTYSFYDIRILSCIVGTCYSIEQYIDLTTDALIQLENYKDHEDYLRVKIVINLNLGIYLFEAKYFDKNYLNDLDEILLESLDIALELSILAEDHYCFSIAMISKGILLKDRVSIYSATKLLKFIGEEETTNAFMKEYIKNIR